MFGNRIEKAMDSDGDGPNAAVVTRYVLDGWNNSKPTPVGNEHFDVYAELDGTNQLLARYLHGDEFDQPFARVRYGEPGVSTPGFLPEVHWRLTDHLNSVRLVLDEAGAVLDQIAYDAFGNVVAQLNPLFDNPILFASREFDFETGLYYHRARYLDPATGRWTTQDPLGFAAGDANLYRYVGNTPTLLVDPSGNIWYPGKYIIQYFREWRRGRELDAQLDELQRRRHDPLAAVMQPGSRPCSIHNTYAIADPAFDRNWRQGMGDAAVLAAVGANWLAAGTTWVSPAGQQLVWQGGRWWNRTANRVATAQEAAAANQAVAAARGAGAPAARTVNHFDEIARFRQRAGLPAFRAEDSVTGTVARAVVNDGTSRAYHGVNTGLSSNSIPSRMEVLQQLQTRGYFRNVTNIGQAPMLAHAEAHALMRAVERTGARSITIYSDRTVCRACRTQLHLLARHLGVTELRVFEAGNPLPYIIMPRP